MTTTTSSMEKLKIKMCVGPPQFFFYLLDFLSVCFSCCCLYFDLGFALFSFFVAVVFFYFIFDLCLVFIIQEAEFQLLSYSPCGSVYWTSQFRCPVSISPKKLLFKTFLSNTVDLSSGGPRLESLSLAVDGFVVDGSEFNSSNQLCFFFHKFLFI